MRERETMTERVRDRHRKRERENGREKVRYSEGGSDGWRETEEMSLALSAHAHSVSCMSDESHLSVKQ